MSGNKPLLRVRNLSKSFGTLPVINKVSFEIQPGEVVGLTGSTGSGKSVLVMLLAGLYEPNEGEIIFLKKRLDWPFAAQSQGIGVIHQRPTLADDFDIPSNIFLGNEIGSPLKLGWLRVLNRHRMDQEATRLLVRLGVEVNSLREKAFNLSGEQRQMIAIARVLTYPAQMVIIDEPTISLSYPFQQRLLSLIQEWREQGVAVLFSSNDLDHLFSVTDRIIILDQGRIAADRRTDEITKEEVVNYLLGTADPHQPRLINWDFDSYDMIRDHAEKLRYHQMLLEKDLAAEGTLNRQLTEQLAEQLRILDQTNLALREAQKRLFSEREQERKSLARELHDRIIQDMLGINYELEEIGSSSSIPPVVEVELTTIRQGIRDLVGNLRQICGNLRPPTIDSLGLGAALQSCTHDWSLRTGIQVELKLDDKLGRLPETTELSIYRIIQEGLNNVWHHAQASRVYLSLLHTSPRTLRISLQDNGTGLGEDLDLTELASDGHFGLMGISERVSLMGGRLHLQNLPEGGSLLMVEIPHPRVVTKK
ncbi:MAG: ATP-binding cassette domain-containing protein [Pelolinea sp.]|nr:ATP-binding cassette domain-containing protein [Pelolinea sp.]